jgi:sulfotransferase
MAVKKYHFISGLPRAGSTLLISILNQNPRFHAEISGPLAGFVDAVGKVLTHGDSTHKISCPPERAVATVRGVIDGYYSAANKEVIFDTHRAWNRSPEYLVGAVPDFKLICPVRNYADILNSFELIYKKRGIREDVLFGTAALNVYTRAEALDKDLLGHCYTFLKECYYGPYRDRLLLVEYQDLVTDPAATMRRLYDFIGEPHFEHDFNNVGFSFPLYDDVTHMPGLHDVRESVSFKPQRIVLPPDLYGRYVNMEFWRKPN